MGAEELKLPLPSLLILDPGLHGEGDPFYYLEQLDFISRIWNGWPLLAYKPQLWQDENSPYAKKVTELHGRLPLASLDERGFANVCRECNRLGIVPMVTPHDLASIKATAPAHALKIGSFDATQEDLVAAIRDTNKPVVASDGYGHRVPGATILDCVSKYPANAKWRDRNTAGYSCHVVPSMIVDYCVDAASRGAKVIEVHLTTRDSTKRPLPGDLCVSLPLLRYDGLLVLLDRLGRIWHQ